MSVLSMKNTKKELLDAYEATARELEQMRKSKTTATRSTTTASTTQPKDVSSLEEIIEGFSTLKSQFSSASNLLQEKLSKEAMALQEVDEKVETNIKNLNRLYEIELNEETLESLMEAYIQREERQEEHILSKKEEGEEAFKVFKENWLKERHAYIQKRDELSQEQGKQEQREKKEYAYTHKQAQVKDTDIFNEQQKIYANEFALLEETQALAWKEKEESVAKEEGEAKEIKEKAQALEETLTKEVKKSTEEGTGIAKRQSKNTAMLLQKDYEGEERVLQLKISSTQTLIAKQETQIVQLSDKLTIAIRQAQDLAVKALEGNANTNSFEAMKEIALEQAKNSSKGK